MGTARLVNAQEVRHAYSLLVESDQVIEARILEATVNSNGQYPATYGGYFDNVESLLSALNQIREAKGIYVTLQTCKPNLIHRTYNELKKQSQGKSTSDNDIIGYRWLLIDSDPDRDPPDISASNLEHGEALAHSRMIAEELSKQGWPSPVIADSGNGGHLLYRIDIPPEDKDLVKRVLEGLGHLYDTSGVHVDQTVFNPGRICKLYGTLVCKGANTAERQHRMSHLIDVPDQREIVSRELLEAMATPVPNLAVSPLQDGMKESFTAQEFIDKHNIDTYPPEPYMSGSRWKLKNCVWNPDHSACCIYQFPDGRLGASCSHNSCKDKGWKDLRLVFEPDAYIPKGEAQRKTRARNKPDETPELPDETPELPDTSLALCDYSADDAGNGDAFYKLFGGKFLYCGVLGWLFYNGTHWELDTDLTELRKHAVKTLRARAYDAVRRKNRAILLCTVGDEKRVNGCINRFKSLVAVKIDVFDHDPDSLNCKNGVVNLQTGELTPHDASQRFTYCLPIAYEQTDYSAWLSFQEGVVGGGKEVLDYLQLCAGYSLTGHTREEILFYLWGPTRSGKGTFAEVMMNILPHPLSTMVDFNSFTAKREGDVSNFDLADLKPSRMIFASESIRSQSLNPAKIKQLTGGDLVRACFKHKNHFTYRPQFKVWMLSNWPVNGDPEDNALWGRVRVIHFPNSYLGREDKNLKSRLKSEEILKGILYWAVQGAIKWYAEGLSTPNFVAITTKKQRDEIDFVQQWLDECCTQVSDEWTSSKALMESYAAWCKSNSVSAKQAKGLAQSLETRGFQVGVQKKQPDKHNLRGVVGLKLVAGSESSTSNGQKTVSYIENRNFPESDATIRYPLPKNDTDDKADSPLLAEIRALYEQVGQHHTKTGEIFWYGGKSGFDNGSLSPDTYLARVQHCVDSRDPIRIQAAMVAMKRTLGRDQDE